MPDTSDQPVGTQRRRILVGEPLHHRPGPFCEYVAASYSYKAGPGIHTVVIHHIKPGLRPGPETTEPLSDLAFSTAG